MHRFFLAPPQCRPPRLELTGAEAHHAIDVLRLRKGEEASVLDGEGNEFICQVSAVERKTVALDIKRQLTSPPRPSAVTLVQAVPKGKLIETIIQKAVELGAARVIPLLTERTVVQLDGDGAAAKAEKWRQVAVEACKQCGQRWLPRVEAPCRMEALLPLTEPPELALAGSLRADARHPRAWFDEFRAAHARPPASVWWWIGPEGDFTDGELAAIHGSGARPATFGPLVLRSDTAASHALSITAHELSAAPRAG